jgi:hypothetical protein
MTRPPHIPQDEPDGLTASDYAVLLVCIVALVVIILTGNGCSHRPAAEPTVKPGPVQLLPNTIPHKVDPADYV